MLTLFIVSTILFFFLNHSPSQQHTLLTWMTLEIFIMFLMANNSLTGVSFYTITGLFQIVIFATLLCNNTSLPERVSLHSVIVFFSIDVLLIMFNTIISGGWLLYTSGWRMEMIFSWMVVLLMNSEEEDKNSKLFILLSVYFLIK